MKEANYTYYLKNEIKNLFRKRGKSRPIVGARQVIRGAIANPAICGHDQDM